MWFHTFGGIIPYDANIIATVWPYLFFKFGSCLQRFGVSIPLHANIIATVKPYLFYSSGLWLPNFGSILKQALSNIVSFSSFPQCLGIGKWLFYNYRYSNSILP